MLARIMEWIAPSEKDTASETLEKRLWDSADQFRANSGLKSQAGEIRHGGNAKTYYDHPHNAISPLILSSPIPLSMSTRWTKSG